MIAGTATRWSWTSATRRGGDSGKVAGAVHVSRGMLNFARVESPYPRPEFRRRTRRSAARRRSREALGPGRSRIRLRRCLQPGCVQRLGEAAGDRGALRLGADGPRAVGRGSCGPESLQPSGLRCGPWFGLRLRQHRQGCPNWAAFRRSSGWRRGRQTGIRPARRGRLRAACWLLRLEPASSGTASRRSSAPPTLCHIDETEWRRHKRHTASAEQPDPARDGCGGQPRWSTPPRWAATTPAGGPVAQRRVVGQRPQLWINDADPVDCASKSTCTRSSPGRCPRRDLRAPAAAPRARRRREPAGGAAEPPRRGLSVSRRRCRTSPCRRSVVTASASGHHRRRDRSPITATPYTRGHSG